MGRCFRDDRLGVRIIRIGRRFVVGILFGLGLLAARGGLGLLCHGYGRGGLNRCAAHRGAEPFAHRLGQAEWKNAHVVRRFVAETFISQLVQNLFALDAQFLGELINSNAFSQNDLQKTSFDPAHVRRIDLHSSLRVVATLGQFHDLSVLFESLLTAVVAMRGIHSVDGLLFRG